MANMNYKRLMSVDCGDWEGCFLVFVVHFLCRIQDDTLDQAFRRIFDRHGDLQCLHLFPWHAFFVLPDPFKMVGKRVTSTDNTVRRDC